VDIEKIQAELQFGLVKSEQADALCTNWVHCS